MRPLPAPLEAALAAGTRQPAYKILAYDPAQDDIGAVVRGEATGEPMDLAPWATQVSWTPQQLGFTLADPDGRFHPDTGEYRQYLRDGTIIRLVEGDVRVDESYWMVTFTGEIRGQVGWQRSRRGPTLTARINAWSRDTAQAFRRRKITSKEYTVGTETGVMLRDLLYAFFGLEEAEIRIPYTLGYQFQHHTNQVAIISPWEAITALLEIVSLVPYFDGDGRLACYSKNLRRQADRTLPDYVQVLDYQAPERSGESVNKVIVQFLDCNLTRVDGPDQKLGQASITTGFFTMREDLDCYWSEDRKQRADKTRLKIIKSVNDNLLPVGEESYAQIDEFHGRVSIEIYWWVPTLAGAMLAEYVALSFEPDFVEVPAFGFWPTITYGKLLQAQAMAGILLIMMSLGSAQYEVWGVPYDMAYLEKESIALEEGLEYYQENELRIENDFIGSHEQADAVAINELIWQKSSSLPRRLIITDDLALELGDIVALPDGRKFCVTGLSKQIQRGAVPVLTLDGFKVMRAAG